MYKAFLNFIKLNKTWSIVIGVVILGVIWYLFSGDKNPVNDNFVLAEIGTIREEVSVTGNVTPLSDVDLAFERGGRVSAINMAVGDKVYTGQILASVSNADLVANVDQAQANLKKALAQYQDAKIGTRSEELALSQTQVDKATLDLAQAKTSFSNTLRDSYTKADDAVRNKIYSLFNDPNRYNAKLIFSTDTFLQEDIEDGKDIVTDNLDTWYRTLSKLDNSTDLDVLYQSTKTNLDIIKVLLDKCATAVNGLTPEAAYTLQSQIDAWKLNISGARTSIDLAISTLTQSHDAYQSASSALKIAQDQLNIKKAGSTSGQLLSAEASYEAAQAGVASAQAELAKSLIRSPINGVITDIPIKLGEIVPMNQKAVSVISYGDYQVETFVPEADISKIKLNNTAKTTLDAYGSDIVFETMVIKIDPAATVIDGVPTYKVTLKFVNQDERIRSGMTANLDILTAEKENVLTIPARAVYTRDGGRYVKIVNVDDSLTEVKVEMGLRGYNGFVEIISGLQEGEKVSTTL